jgi:polyhydroxyalkanoate synthesis regulator phasin
LDKAGAAGAGFKDRLASLSLELRQATAAADGLKVLQDLEKDLLKQAQTFGLSEAAMLQYRMTTGDLAEAFAVAGDEGEALRQRIIDLNNELQQKQFEERGIEIAAQVMMPIDERANPALKEYRDTIAELNELVARGAITQDIYNQAVEMAQEAFDKANKSGEAFLEQASRNVQDILAEYLEDPFSSSIEDMIADFGRMLVRMAAQAIAADIAGKIFGDGVGSGGGWVGTAMSAIGGFFGGGMDQGGRGQAGKAYLIGTGAQPEMFVPDSAGTFIPNVDREQGRMKLAKTVSRLFGGKMDQGGMGQAGRAYLIGASAQPEAFVPDRPVRVASTEGGKSQVNHFNFNVSAPGGRVSRETEQQIAAAAARGLRQADRRNN